MTKRVLDYDPWSKMTTYFEYLPHEDRTIITSEQDADANLEWSKGLAKDADYTKKGLKKEFMHYAHIPAGVMMELMMKHGIDMNDTQALRRKIDTDYPYLKVTTLKVR